MLGRLLVGTIALAFGGADATPPPEHVTKIQIGNAPPPGSDGRPNYDRFDHAPFDALLHEFVDGDGMVHYRAWKHDPSAMGRLHEYLIALGQVDTRDPDASKAGEISFFINAYNALVLYGILMEYPTASIQRHNGPKSDYRIFDDLELWIDGEYLSLNAIEHDILRNLEEPRIHFAIVCAAYDCPRLRAEAYRGATLEAQLTDNALDFFAAPRRFSVHPLTHSVHLSSILRWFGADFGASEAQMMAAIGPYLPPAAQKWLARYPCPKVRYLGYNWSLNDACPSLKIRLGGIPHRLYAHFEPVIRPWRHQAPAATEAPPEENRSSQRAAEEE